MSAELGAGLRLARWRCRLARRARDLLGLNPTVYVDQRIAEYRRYWEEAAQHISAEFHPLTDGVWEVRKNGRKTRLANHITQCDDFVTLRLAGDKEYCYRLAQSVGLPVPPHLVFGLGQLDHAREFLARQGGPLVVKPVKGSSSGLGVTTHVRTWSELRRGAVLASLFGERILLEAMVLGESYRLLYLDGRCIHAVRRRGVRVTGDGRRPVRELLRSLSLGPLEGDLTTALTLSAQGWSLDTVPPDGKELVVRSLPVSTSATCELRTVYDEAVTGLLAPELMAEAGRVVQVLGSEFAGVDLITNDPSVPLARSGGIFLEINTTPGIHHHYVTPDPGTALPVGAQVLNYLLGDRTRT